MTQTDENAANDHEHAVPSEYGMDFTVAQALLDADPDAGWMRSHVIRNAVVAGLDPMPQTFYYEVLSSKDGFMMVRGFVSVEAV